MEQMQTLDPEHKTRESRHKCAGVGSVPGRDPRFDRDSQRMHRDIEFPDSSGPDARQNMLLHIFFDTFYGKRVAKSPLSSRVSRVILSQSAPQ